MKPTHLYYRPRSVTPKELRLIRERAIRKRKLAEFCEEEIELGEWEGPYPLSQKEFEESERALAMEKAGHAILGKLGHGTLAPPSDVFEYPLESEDRWLQRLLDRISFDFEWPAQELELARGEWLQIDRNVPLLGKIGPHGAKYPYPQMQVGDSFLFPKGLLPHSARSSAFHAGKKAGWKFIVRKVPEGLCCWRVE